MTIMEDKKGTHHLVRFASVNERELSVCRGMLGLAASFSNAAVDSAKKTMSVFLEFSTPLHGAPGKANSLLQHDDALLQHLRSITEVGVADGLVAAQNALVLLRDEGFAPHMKTVIRDLAHTGQSLYKRPWARMSDATVAFLKQFIVGAQSAASVVQNSEAFREVFRKKQSSTDGVVDAVFGPP